MACLLCRRPIHLNRLVHLISRSTPITFSRNIADDKNHDSDNGPVNVLRTKISKGELEADEYQMQIAKSLQRVYEDIRGYEPEKPPGMLSKWLGGGKKKKKLPQGLYLYGAVGGGKTMLMDLFYNCCQVS